MQNLKKQKHSSDLKTSKTVGCSLKCKIYLSVAELVFVHDGIYKGGMVGDGCMSVPPFFFFFHDGIKIPLRTIL